MELIARKDNKMSETINDSTLAFSVTNLTPSIKFLASLSDGRTVIQDNRTGPEQKHAWARLAEWIKNNTSISITEVRLQGPKNIDIKMPPNQKGYFFGKKCFSVWGGPQRNYVGVGYYDGQQVNISWHKEPLFDSSFSEERTAEKAGFFLIKNH